MSPQEIEAFQEDDNEAMFSHAGRYVATPHVPCPVCLLIISCPCTPAEVAAYVADVPC